ncbi:MAG: glycosyltransferase [Acidobacteria bacterium]|nr:glycosyltransferase [Acidobacteriota bacterium]
MIPRLAIVVPCYNESEILPSTITSLSSFLEELRNANRIRGDSYVICVDDGSQDGTWGVICASHAAEPDRIKGIKLAGNVGHQKALLAGLHKVRGKADCAVSIDADLQDDFRAIVSMLDAFKQGAEVVYGVRQERRSDPRLKRWTALGFYKLMKLLGVGIIENHADFRLLSAKALECLAAYQESNLFLRGIVPSMGFATRVVMYDRKPRAAGVSKYPLRKMLSFAWEGISSFSSTPLRLISFAGLVLFMLSVAAATYSLVAYLTGHTIVGWTSVAIALYMLGGIQLLAIGILGEYLAKIYFETKHRPAYFIEHDLQ